METAVCGWSPGVRVHRMGAGESGPCGIQPPRTQVFDTPWLHSAYLCERVVESDLTTWPVSSPGGNTWSPWHTVGAQK